MAQPLALGWIDEAACAFGGALSLALRKHLSVSVRCMNAQSAGPIGCQLTNRSQKAIMYGGKNAWEVVHMHLQQEHAGEVPCDWDAASWTQLYSRYDSPRLGLQRWDVRLPWVGV